MSWLKVSSQNPCPICHKTDWCTYTDDGQFCHCHRVPSQRKTPSGWIHRLAESVSGEALVPMRPKPQVVETPSVDAEAYFNALPTGKIQVQLCRYLTHKLGICADTLQMLDVRWDAKAKAAAFPMRNAEDKVVGIRYRDPKTGQKWTLKGSHDGLFFISHQMPFSTGELVICEGPTDTIAAISCGMVAVGRSSCSTGTKMLRDLVRKYRFQRVTIAADADSPKTRPDGSTWNPGLDGAKRLAAEIGVASRIVLPPMPHKDLRDWYAKGGMTGEDFNVAAASAKWLTPEN